MKIRIALQKITFGRYKHLVNFTMQDISESSFKSFTKELTKLVKKYTKNN